MIQVSFRDQFPTIDNSYYTYTWALIHITSPLPLPFPQTTHFLFSWQTLNIHFSRNLFCLPPQIFHLSYIFSWDRLCGLVVRVPGYRFRDLGLESRRYKILWVVGLERGSFSLVRLTEELLECKSSGSGSRKSRLTAVGIRCADHVTPSIRKSWHLLRPPAAVARSV
jgi:hypothetical protein